MTARSIRALVAMTAVVLLVQYVETMVLPGLPTIQKDFSTTESLASWITSAFLIVGAAASVLFGRLGDTYGKKRMFLVSMGFYAVGVGLAGFSPTIYILLFARALQGIGFASLPLALAIIPEVFPEEKVATGQGVLAGIGAIGTVLGIVVGSRVVENFGWQWAFHSALALSLALIAFIAVALDSDVPSTRRRVDYAGASLIMAGVSLLLIYATEGPTLGWLADLEVAVLGIGLALTIGFFFLEARRKEPLMPLGLLKVRNILVANLLSVLVGVASFVIFFAVIYYAQLPTPFGLGLDITSTGYALLPATLVMFAVGPMVGRATSRFGPRPVLAVGAAALVLGLFLFIVNRASSAALGADVAVSFAGAVALAVPIVNMISVSLPKERVATGQGMNSMLKSLGQAAGPVIASTIMSSYTVPLIRVVNGQTIVLAQLPSSTAFDLVFEVGIGLSLVMLAVGLATKNYSFHRPASGRTPSATTSRRVRNLNTMREWTELHNHGEYDGALALLDDDAELQEVPTGINYKGIAPLREMASVAFVGKGFKEITGLFASEDWACVEWYAHGSLADASNVSGPSIVGAVKPGLRPRDGRQEVVLKVCCLAHFNEDGRIDLMREYWDLLSLLTQLDIDIREILHDGSSSSVDLKLQTTRSGGTPSETEARNMRVVSEWIAGHNRHDVEGALVDFDKDVELEVVPTGVRTKGTDALKELSKVVYAQDAYKEITNLFASEDWACAEYDARGSLSGAANVSGPTVAGYIKNGIRVTTGKEYLDLKVCFLCHFNEEGKIDRCREYWDLATVLTQLGTDLQEVLRGQAISTGHAADALSGLRTVPRAAGHLPDSIERIRARFADERVKASLKGFSRTVRVSLTDLNEDYLLVVHDGALSSIEEDGHRDADITVTATDSLLSGVFSKTVNSTMAVVTGKLKVKGESQDLEYLRRLIG